MNVLLIEDVPTLGRTGDVVSVKPGYGRNYLLPQGLAVLATKGAVKQADTLRRNAERRRARDLSDAQDFAKVLGELLLTFARKVGDKGRLFGSVTNADVAEQISEQMQLSEELDKRKVLLEEPIKALGDFPVHVYVHPEVTATVAVRVIGDQGETAADFAEEPEAPAAEASVEESDPQPVADY
ncbi:MAG: 50S ribosomal protein L9 [Anaerolineales bacterium]|nr:50S ribosomal protein L9 [Anaerolineales bacterium]MCB9127309.1 50S ribosomal protein L9 [Ardenticatenales bacterium]MCB9172598.1 50S ribosomal protein L9 [Ardenticatenales bacterium]